MIGFGARIKLNHREAYCLMRYQDVVTGEIEIFWNSRDGVTPFCCSSRAGNESRHVNWGLDRFDPMHLPLVGDRIFVDMTPERALYHAQAYVEAFWDGGMSDHYDSREEVVCSLSKSYMEPAGSPDIITVDQGMLDQLLEKRAIITRASMAEFDELYEECRRLYGESIPNKSKRRAKKTKKRRRGGRP